MTTPATRAPRIVATSTATRATSSGKAAHLRAASRHHRAPRHVTAHVDTEVIAMTNVPGHTEARMQLVAVTTVVTTATLATIIPLTGTELTPFQCRLQVELRISFTQKIDRDWQF